jgi:nucleoside-diphosphate-sugar epimerase
MSSILITGGCGFLGSHLARALLKLDHNVILMDSHINEKLIQDIKSKSTIVTADITDILQLKKILKEYDVDGIVHYAALKSAAAESNPNHGYKVNFEGLWNTFDAARASEVGTIIFASSVAAYGSDVLEVSSLRENIYSIPETLYGISKQYGEMLGLWFYKKFGIQFAALRYGPVIGPGREDGGASAYTTLIIQKPAQGDPIEINVRKSDQLPIAYIKDVVDVTRKTYENITKLKSRIYNIASLNPSPTAGELANTVKEFLPKANITFKPDPTTIDMVNTWPKNFNFTQIQNELQWKPKYDNLQVLIRDFIDEVKKHPSIYYI